MKRMKKSSFTDGTQRRTKYEIWAEILELCLHTPLHQSKILRNLNITTAKVQESLGFLLERDLIIQIEDGKGKWFQFQTTKKGEAALDGFYNLIMNYFTPKS